MKGISSRNLLARLYCALVLGIMLWAAAGRAGASVPSAAIAAANAWVSLGPAGVQILALAAPPSSFVTLYASVLNAGIYRSRDAGFTWSPINTGLTNVNINALLTHPLTPVALYAATEASGTFVYNRGPALRGNFAAGAPGSSFLFEGAYFQPDSRLNVMVNGQKIAGIDAQVDGSCRFLLTTDPAASVGSCLVSVSDGQGFGSGIVYQLLAGAEQRNPPDGAPEPTQVPVDVRLLDKPVLLPIIPR